MKRLVLILALLLCALITAFPKVNGQSEATEDEVEEVSDALLNKGQQQSAEETGTARRPSGNGDLSSETKDKKKPNFLYQLMKFKKDKKKKKKKKKKKYPLVTFSTRTQTSTETSTITSSTIGLCAQLVNVTGACRRRRGVWVEDPIILSFDDDMDEIDGPLSATSTLSIETTAEPELPGASLTSAEGGQSSATFIQSSKELDEEAEEDDEEEEEEEDDASEEPTDQRLGFQQLLSLKKTIKSRLKFNLITVISTVLTTTTTTTTSYTTISIKTFFIQLCTPSPFPFNICSSKKKKK